MSPAPKTSQANESDFSWKEFSYSESSSHIRVLRIKNESKEHIRCEMKSIKRPANRSESSYSCLSYTWQPEDPKRQVYIEGEQIKEGWANIGKNLGDFLDAASVANVTDWLWIDALCINQGSVAEREQQVKQMGQTYKQAKQVFVWLGLFEQPTMNALEDLVRVIRESSGPLDVLSLDKFSNHQEDLVRQISSILSVPYWTRAWIAQEFILAAEPILFLRNSQISAHTLSIIVSSMASNDIAYNTLEDLPGHRYFWWRFVRYEVTDRSSDQSTRPMDQSVSLASLLRRFTRSGCKHKRDSIYAILSIADDGDPELVSYTVSEDALFRNIMALMRRQKRPLDELLLIGEALIETLELWPTTDPLSSFLEMNFVNTEDITMPIWGYATLEIAEAVEEVQNESFKATCMYVGIRDGPDVHVFEYAVEKVAQRPIVKYSRAHEYLRGRSPACVASISENGVPYYWLEGMPSEALHYFANPDANTRQLKTWEALNFHFPDNIMEELARHRDRLILPARRKVDSMRSSEYLAWEGYGRPRTSKYFTSANEDLFFQSIAFQYDIPNPPVAKHPRSTTIRWEAPQQTDESDQTEEDSDDEAYENVLLSNN